MSEAVCTATSLVVRYGKAIAVEGADLDVFEGTTTALVGPNGAGKSSMLNAIAGVIPVAEGNVAFHGDDVTRMSATARACRGLVVVPQGRQLFPTLTVKENLQVVADTLGCSSNALDEAMDRFPILRTRMKSIAGVLSGGEQQMLAIARGLMSEPSVLLLDEPTLGLAPAIIAEVMHTVSGIAEAGTAVVIAEPSIQVVKNVVSGGSVLVRGRIVARASSPEDLETQIASTSTSQQPPDRVAPRQDALKRKEPVMTDLQEVRYEIADQVATITIDRPEKYNAVRTETLSELAECFRRAAMDADVGVIVLTGAGDKAFCSGGDVAWEADGSLQARDAELQMRAVYAEMRASLKPIIARVNGYAIGGGNHMAYVCDFTIAADHAIFGQVGPRVGSPAQGWLVSYLVRVVGAKRAREMWMLCRRYTAEQMLHWGLVNAAVPYDKLDETVRQWCDELLSLSPTVLKVVKRSFDEEYADLRDRQEAADYLEEINPEFFSSGEQLEGANAFLEKRPPDFSRFRT